MLGLNLPSPRKEGLNVLCLGAHSDDIEIGCGATLLQLKRTHAPLNFTWIVLSASGVRGKEAGQSAELFTAGANREIILKEFRDGFFPYDGGAIKTFFEELKASQKPDLIFTHWGGDAHQDHRIVSELTWNTFRDHFILEYEIPKFDGDLGTPNVFVPLAEHAYSEKVQYLLQAFASQRSKRWFQSETFLGLMRIRGMESNSPTGYAEAFHGRKVCLGISERGNRA